MRAGHAGLALCCVVACARGGGDPAAIDAPRADASIKEDAHVVVPIDAPDDAARPVDARPVDATVPDGAIVCSDNDGCTTAGTCCLFVGSDFGFCTDGAVEFGVCIPK